MKQCKRLFLWGLLSFGMVLGSRGQIPSASSSSYPVKGGVAKINITPPIGCRLAGHFYESISTGVHDSLWAKSMVLQQGKQKFALVFCDLIGLTANISASARSMASVKTGIPVANILIAATHSHTGPLFYGFQRDYFHNKALTKGVDPHEKTDYPEFLVHQL